MLIFFETPTGFALLKKGKGKTSKEVFNLQSFYKFKSKSEACKSIESLRNTKIPKTLKQFLRNNSDTNQSLVMNDSGLKKEMIKKINPFFRKILAKKKIFRDLRTTIDENTKFNEFFEKKNF